MSHVSPSAEHISLSVCAVTVCTEGYATVLDLTRVSRDSGPKACLFLLQKST